MFITALSQDLKKVSVHIYAIGTQDSAPVTFQTSQVSLVKKLKNLWLDDAASMFSITSNGEEISVSLVFVYSTLYLKNL